jgi:hypothetical protein
MHFFVMPFLAESTHRTAGNTFSAIVVGKMQTACMMVVGCPFGSATRGSFEQGAVMVLLSTNRASSQHLARLDKLFQDRFVVNPAFPEQPSASNGIQRPRGKAGNPR